MKVYMKDCVKLGISVTRKIHTVIFRIIGFWKIIGRGLVPWSEPTGENVHHDFKETLKRYTVNDSDPEIHGENWIKAVSAYNSWHL